MKQPPILKSASTIRNSQVDMRASLQKQVPTKIPQLEFPTERNEPDNTFLTSFEPPLHSVSIRQSVNQVIIPEEPKDIRE